MALACFILDIIWYSFLSLVCCRVFDRRTYLSFAFSSFCLEQLSFYRLLFLCCICFEAATSTCSSHFWDSYSGGHIMCHASMRRSHCWLRFWVVVVMISDWYFSMLSFQHLHDVIYIRLIQTNKSVTRLLRILPL